MPLFLSSQPPWHLNASNYQNDADLPGRQLIPLMVDAIHDARPSEARFIALKHITQHPHDRSYLAHVYQEITAAHYLDTSKTTTSPNGENDPHHETMTFPNYLNRLGSADFEKMTRPLASLDAVDCLREGMEDDWDTFCSILPQADKGEAEENCDVNDETSSKTSSFWPIDDRPGCDNKNNNHRRPCCELFHGSSSYKRLPALHEPAIRVLLHSSHSSGTDTDIGSEIGLDPSKNKYHINQKYRQSESPSTTIVLDLEQEGYLRPFDVSGVLWPSAYLLTLCVADLVQCGATELSMTMKSINDCSSGPVAVELGTGIGAPSIALSLILQKQQTCTSEDPPNEYTVGGTTTSIDEMSAPARVVATDAAPQSLAITLANAKFNHANSLGVAKLNFTDMEAVRAFKSKYFLPQRVANEQDINRNEGGRENEALSDQGVYSTNTTHTTTKRTTPTMSMASESFIVARNGFTILMGSSLQSLFHDPLLRETQMLWKVLDELLDSENPHAMAILAHTMEDPIDDPPEDSGFVLLRRISGDVFDMTTRSGDSSDFALSILQRRRKKQL